VVVTRQKISIAYGVLEHAEGRVVEFREKPTQQFSVSTGIYCMRPEVFDFIPPTGPYGFDQLMRAMLDNGVPVGVFEHLGTWIDIGRVEDLRKAQEQAARPFVDEDVV
jgi:NDP-sugar pyrophosphorylase family protein